MDAVTHQFQVPDVFRAVRVHVVRAVVVGIDQRAIGQQFLFYLRGHQRHEADNLVACACDQAVRIAVQVQVHAQRFEELKPVLVAVHLPAEQPGKVEVTQRLTATFSHAVEVQIKRGKDGGFKLHRRPHGADLHRRVFGYRVLRLTEERLRPLKLDAHLALDARAGAAPEQPRGRIKQA